MLSYNPMARGFLRGKYNKGDDLWEGSRFQLGTAGKRYRQRYWDDAYFDAVQLLREGLDGRGHAMASVAIAWVLAQPGITAAIVGASSAEQLEPALDALDIELDDELRELCDNVWLGLPRRKVIEGYR